VHFCSVIHRCITYRFVVQVFGSAVEKCALANRSGDVAGHVVIEKRVQLVGTVSGGGGRAVGLTQGRRRRRRRWRSLRVCRQFACKKTHSVRE